MHIFMEIFQLLLLLYVEYQSVILIPWSLAGKEVDIGLGGGCDKLLRPADLLLYSWDERLDVCVNLTWSLPLTHTDMVDFVPDLTVIDATHRKRVKYEARHQIWFSHLFIFFAWGIREGCGDPTEADPKVLRDSRH
ncbi:hypothetical protein Tco_0026612 [Tanacetum coccineum]